MRERIKARIAPATAGKLHRSVEVISKVERGAIRRLLHRLVRRSWLVREALMIKFPCLWELSLESGNLLWINVQC